MDKDYNFSHRFYKKFIHNMVRKESEIIIQVLKNYYIISN